jgi:hypothetical protein
VLGVGVCADCSASFSEDFAQDLAKKERISILKKMHTSKILQSDNVCNLNKIINEEAISKHLT